MDEPTPRLFAFFNEIGIIHQLAVAMFERAMPEGMTIAQFTMLNHLIRMGEARSPQQMARSFQVTKGAVTHTLGKLEGKGFIDVAADPSDGRAKLVAITEDGRAMHADCIARLGPWFARMEAELPTGALVAATPLLSELRRWLDASR